VPPHKSRSETPGWSGSRSPIAPPGGWSWSTRAWSCPAISRSPFLSLFPFLIFLATLAGFLGDRQTANEFIQSTFHFMPEDVAETLAPAVREVVGVSERGLLTFSILATLWFASSGVEGLRSGLNRAYTVSDERAIWWLRLQSITFVIASAFVIFVLSLVLILGPLVPPRSSSSSARSSMRSGASAPVAGHRRGQSTATVRTRKAELRHGEGVASLPAPRSSDLRNAIGRESMNLKFGEIERDEHIAAAGSSFSRWLMDCTRGRRPRTAQPRAGRHHEAVRQSIRILKKSCYAVVYKGYMR